MKAQISRSHAFLFLFAMMFMAMLGSTTVLAQDIPPEQGRQIRGYIPPDQLVSFRPETPFTQFIDFINPIFERVNGKQAIDPESREQPIGISIAGMHYFDAFEVVLNFNGLTYRETDRFFLIELLPPEAETAVAQAGSVLAQTTDVPATLDSREIQISAVLFSINKNKSRDLGVDWNVFFGGDTASGGGGATTGGTGTTTGSAGVGVSTSGDIEAGVSGGAVPQFFVKTDDLADVVDNWLIMPDQFNVATLTKLFRFLENEGAGETVANPSITVQSGVQGRIQIGTDFPFVTRDFSGNTITNFISTGIIINVVPTLITEAVADTAGAPTMEFIHLNVQVENSNGAISPAGPIVDRSSANTQILLLDGEQTVIGGLYSTEESISRRGIPFLKDLPGWFFGIRYLVSVQQKIKIQRELVILLKASLIDPIHSRETIDEQLLERWRQRVEEDLKGLSEKCDPKFMDECKSTESN